MNAPFDSRNGPKHLSSQAFLALGAMHFAYVKPVVVDGAPAYAIHTADGSELAVFADRDVAIIAARQNDLEPVSVH